jgi:hypothetical protein
MATFLPDSSYCSPCVTEWHGYSLISLSVHASVYIERLRSRFLQKKIKKKREICYRYIVFVEFNGACRGALTRDSGPGIAQ